MIRRGVGGRRQCVQARRARRDGGGCGGSGRDPLGSRTRTASTTRKPAVSNLADELAKLAELHALGVLTDAEFRQAKAKLLGS